MANLIVFGKTDRRGPRVVHMLHPRASIGSGIQFPEDSFSDYVTCAKDRRPAMDGARTAGPAGV